MIRRILMVVMASLVFLSSFAGLREYRRRQWRPVSEAWLAACLTELTPTTGEGMAKRICACEFDYISARWTPANYGRHYQRINDEMRKTGIHDDCIDLAAGFAKHRP